MKSWNFGNTWTVEKHRLTTVCRVVMQWGRKGDFWCYAFWFSVRQDFTASREHHFSKFTKCSRYQLCKVDIGKGEVIPYSLPSVGPGADPSVQAVSPQVTVKSSSGGRLPLLSARPASLPCKRSSDGATTDWGGERLIAALYSFIDPVRMKGWVGLENRHRLLQ